MTFPQKYARLFTERDVMPKVPYTTIKKRAYRTAKTLPGEGKTWQQEYNKIWEHYVKALSPKEIAEKINYPINYVNKVLNSEVFLNRAHHYYTTYNTEHLEAKEFLASKKYELIMHLYHIAINGQSESNRKAALEWCLSRFPEFADKNVPTIIQAQQTLQLTEEDIKRNESAADKLAKVYDLLRNGNPNVLDTTTTRLLDGTDTPQENTDAEGGDTSAP